jgi:hypothetical protein
MHCAYKGAIDMAVLEEIANETDIMKWHIIVIISNWSLLNLRSHLTRIYERCAVPNTDVLQILGAAFPVSCRPKFRVEAAIAAPAR